MALHAATLAFTTVACLAPTASTLAVFDCQHPNATVQVIDITEPGPCTDPATDYQDPADLDIQILQSESDFRTVAHQCAITVTTKICRCGHASANYGCFFDKWEQMLPVSLRTCQELLDNKPLVYEERTFSARPGRKTSHTFFSHGGTGDATCIYGSPRDLSGRVHKQAYEETILVISLFSFTAEVDAASGDIRFPSGLMAPFAAGVAQDAREGTLLWDPTPPDCAATVSELYSGRATIRRKTDMHGREQNAIIMVANNETEQFAGFMITGPQQLCGRNCMATSTAGITICPLAKNGAVQTAEFRPEVDGARAQAASQLGFHHLAAAQQNVESFIELQRHLCDVDRRTLSNKLQAIAGSANPYSLVDRVPTGHSVVVAGNAAYLTTCVSVEATRDMNFQNCTSEIPVTVNNQTMFVDPFTWILMDTPTYLLCDPVMPVRWKIGGQWHCQRAMIGDCKGPKQLQPLSDGATFDVGSYTVGLGSGIYNDAMLAAHKNYMRKLNGRRSIVQRITDSAIDDGSQGADGLFHMGLILAGNNVDKLKNKLREHIFPWFKWFRWLGSAWYWISTALFVLLVLKLLLGASIRGYRIYVVRGCGPWLCMSLWATCYVIAATPVEILKNTAKAITEKTSEEAAESRAVAHLQQTQDNRSEMFVLQEQVRQLNAQRGENNKTLADIQLSMMRPIQAAAEATAVPLNDRTRILLARRPDRGEREDDEAETEQR